MRLITQNQINVELHQSEILSTAGRRICIVRYDREIEATVDVWTGDFESQENLRRGLELVLQNIEKNKSAKWLADLSQIEGSFEESRGWITNNVVPRAMKLGLKYEALVLPKNIFAMLSVQETLIEIEGLKIRTFGDTHEAIAWLNSL